MVMPNTSPYANITNTGTVNVYTTGNLLTPIATHVASANVFPYPRLSINKTFTGNPPQINASSQIVQPIVTYQITLSNSGSIAATGIVFQDMLPYGFVLNSITPVSGTPALGASTYILPTNTHMWTGLTIPANTTYTYNVTGSLNNVLALPGQQFTNT